MNKKEEARQNMKGMFHRIMVGFIITLAVFIVGGLIFISLRTPKTADLGSSIYFSEDKVYEKAQEVINLIEEGNYAVIRSDYCNAEIKEKMTDEALAEGKVYLSENWGAFVEMKSRRGYEVKESNVYYAMVQIKNSYENVEVTYTIMFDVNMKLAGLSME